MTLMTETVPHVTLNQTEFKVQSGKCQHVLFCEVHTFWSHETSFEDRVADEHQKLVGCGGPPACHVTSITCDAGMRLFQTEPMTVMCCL